MLNSPTTEAAALLSTRLNRSIRRPGLGRAWACCACALLGWLLLGDARAQPGAFSEDEVKAAFLYHFGTYVQWPLPSAEPVTIGVFGGAGVAEQLALFLPGRTIQGRNVEIRRLQSLDALEGVDMLFIGSEHNRELEALLAAVADRPVLTVTHAPDGLEHGAIVNFQVVEERVRFEISVPASERAGLMLSSRLLSAALRVRTSWCKLGCVPPDDRVPTLYARKKPLRDRLPT